MEGDKAGGKPGPSAQCFIAYFFGFVFGSIRVVCSLSGLIGPVLVGPFVWCCGSGHWACLPMNCSGWAQVQSC